MSIRNKIKKKIREKNLNPMSNRKKVGIILFATSIGLFFLFTCRFAYIVATGKVAGVSLEEKTKELYEGSSVVKAKRGAILDRYGKVIAEDATSYSVVAIISESRVDGKGKKLYVQQKDFNKAAEIIAKYTGMKKEEALVFLNNGINDDGTTRYQVEFGSKGQNLTLQTKQNIEAEMADNNIEGITFQEQAARIYPNGIFSSHFIGYTDVTNKGLEGKMGLELAYDKILSGKDGRIYYEKDRFENPIPGTIAEEKKAVDGQDVYTTLDSRLQSRLETLMDSIVEEAHPENMTAMLMNAKTGEILAMAQRPTFNPETKKGLDEEDSLWRNILVEDQFEPGSTMKLFTVASAMQEGIFNPDEPYQAGTIKVADTDINDHDIATGGKGVITFRQALSWSSNVGMVILESRLGNKWAQYLEKFMFGQSVDTGLQSEVNGELPTDNVVDQAMSSFGQAISVTDFQMMRAYTAISNNGSMLEPYFVSKVVDNNTGAETIKEPTIIGNPISSDVAMTLREYMRDTIEDPVYGIAYEGHFEVPGYHIAAKTGTAQIQDPTTGKYMLGSRDNLYSIVEMMPAEDPTYVFYIKIKRPEEGTAPTQLLAKVANPFMQLAMDLKDTATAPVTASATAANSSSVTVTDFTNLTVDQANADAEALGLTPIIIGDGQTIIDQSTDPGETLLQKQKLLLMTDGNKIMPDVTGWSKGDLVKLGSLFNIEVEFQGDGYATNQSLAAGEAISGDKITVALESTETSETTESSESN